MAFFVCFEPILTILWVLELLLAHLSGHFHLFRCIFRLYRQYHAQKCPKTMNLHVGFAELSLQAHQGLIFQGIVVLHLYNDIVSLYHG